MICGIASAFFSGSVDGAVTAALRSASSAVETVFEFMGAMCLWLGLLKIAERSGLTLTMSRALSPMLRLLMPGIPPGHPALGAISMSVSANLLGLGSAATPLGLKAMEELKRLNRGEATASTPMCTFVAMVCSGFTLVPGGMVALRAQMGSGDPSAVVGPTVLCGFSALVAVLFADAALRARR